MAVFGIFLSWLMFTEWFTVTCTDSCDSITDILFIPAVIIGAIVGGGVHGMNEMHFTIGMVIELWIIWTVGKWVIKTVQRKKSHNKRMQSDPAKLGR